MGSVNRMMMRSGASCSSEFAAGSDDTRFAWAETCCVPLHNQAGIRTSASKANASEKRLHWPLATRLNPEFTCPKAANEFLDYKDRRAWKATNIPPAPSSAPTMPMIRATMASVLPPPSPSAALAWATRAAS